MSRLMAGAGSQQDESNTVTAGRKVHLITFNKLEIRFIVGIPTEEQYFFLIFYVTFAKMQTHNLSLHLTSVCSSFFNLRVTSGAFRSCKLFPKMVL